MTINAIREATEYLPIGEEDDLDDDNAIPTYNNQMMV